MHFVLPAILAIALCASVSPATAQVNPSFDPALPIRVVYRVDFTRPYDAFTTGFSASGMVGDLLSLTSGAPCSNVNPPQRPAWVAMTTDREQALRFARRHLESLPWSGRAYPVFLFSIRADANYISVPGSFYSAIDAGREGRAGYTGDHASALEYLLYTRPILGEQAVVAAQVRPRSIANATVLWLQGGELLEDSAPIVNSGYLHDGSTAATNIVPDSQLPGLLPHHAILSSEAGASGSCAMSCDRATSASSYSLRDEIDYAAQCSQSEAISPLLFDIIND